MRTSQNRRRLAAAAIAFTVMSTFVACGSEGSGQKPAAEASEAAPTIEPGTKLSAADANGVLEKAVASMSTVHVTISLDAVEDGEKVTGQGEGDFQQDPLAFHVKGDVTGADGTTQVEFVTIDDEAYANMDGEWVKGGFVSAMSAMMPSPNLFVESVSKAVADGTTTYVGQESVNDVDTAHYTFAAGESDFGEEGSMVDAHLDPDGRLIRLQMDGGDSVQVVFDFSAHGEPVTIEKPAGKVTDMSDMDMG